MTDKAFPLVETDDNGDEKGWKLFIRHHKHALIVLLLAALYLLFQTHVAINTDVISLARSATRLYEGLPYIRAVYETNLPSSPVLYLPVPMLMELGWGFIPAIFVYGFILQGFLVAVNALYFKRFFDTERHINSKLILVFAFFFVGMGHGFFQRDYIIVLLLLPYMAMEWTGLTSSLRVRRSSPWPLVMMSVACLIKPHYAAIPLFFYSWRLVRDCVNRNVTFSTAHFTIPLASIAIIFGGYWIAFPEFFTVILSDILQIYIGMDIGRDPSKIRAAITTYALCLIITIIIMFFCKRLMRCEGGSQTVFFFFVASILFFIPYLLQNKGFGYHLYPSLCFIVACLFLMLIYEYRMMSIFIVLALLLTVSLPYQQFDKANPAVKYALPLNAYLTKHHEPGTFIIPYYSMAFGNELSGYSQFWDVSRFPSFWPYFKFTKKDADDQDNKDKQRFYSYFFEDIVTQKPDYLIVPYVKDKEKGNEVFNYALRQKDFKTYLKQHYKKVDDGEFDNLIYGHVKEHEMIHFDLYQRYQ